MENYPTYAVTFGRMNLPHPGHVNLVKRMLEAGEQAIVCLSTAKKNHDFSHRAELLEALCAAESLPMDRIEFVPMPGPYDAVSHVKERGEAQNTTVVLGVDQTKLGERLRDDLNVKFVPNEVRVGSSTVIRYFLEYGDVQFVREIYHNDEKLFKKMIALYKKELAK
jgi:cytidyltransferase-like protein